MKSGPRDIYFHSRMTLALLVKTTEFEDFGISVQWDVSCHIVGASVCAVRSYLSPARHIAFIEHSCSVCHADADAVACARTCCESVSAFVCSLPSTGNHHAHTHTHPHTCSYTSCPITEFSAWCNACVHPTDGPHRRLICRPDVRSCVRPRLPQFAHPLARENIR